MTAIDDPTARFLALANATRPNPTPAAAAFRLPTSPVAGGGYATAALAAEIAAVTCATEGTRNATLNKAVFNIAQLVAAGHLDQADVETRFRQAAADAGLPPGEAAATIRSGLRGGGRYPRQVPPPTDAHHMPDVEEITPTPGPDPTADPNIDPDPDGDGVVDHTTSTWWARPILDHAATQNAAPQPTILTRTDGAALIYPGKINSLIGESESGKSWVALCAATQLLAQNRRVVILDFEDTAHTWIARLHLTGVIDQQLANLTYADPDDTLDAIGRAALTEIAAQKDTALIIIDGANAAMTLLGLDLNSNTDATIFNRRILKPLTANGAAVLTIDHVPKNAEQRGKGAIGAQAKRAMIDGTQIAVEIAQPFGVGQQGELRLLVDKDRAGYVRGQAAGARHAGKMIIDSTTPGHTLLRCDPPTGGATGQPWQPTYLMERISRLLEDVPAGLTGRVVTQEIRGRAEHVRAALDALCDGGWVERATRTGRGGGVIFTLHEPYREGETAPKKKCVQVRPKCVPDALPESASQSHSPVGVGRTSDALRDAQKTDLPGTHFGTHFQGPA